MTTWHKQTYELKEGHEWKAKPGCKIFVGGRGVVRCDIPQEWVCLPDSDSIKFYDRIPKEDARCMLAVSWLFLAPVDWSGLPVCQLVQTVVDGDEREILAKGEIRYEQRPDMELAWTEICFMDINERREACSRICIGRGTRVQCLITMDCWPEDVPRLDPVWTQVLQSLELEITVQDPTSGPVDQ